MLLQAQQAGHLAAAICSAQLLHAPGNLRNSRGRPRCQQAGLLWQPHPTCVGCAGQGGAEGGAADGQVRPDSKDAASAAPSGGDDPLAAARLQEVRLLGWGQGKACLRSLGQRRSPGPSVAAAAVHHLQVKRLPFVAAPQVVSFCWSG